MSSLYTSGPIVHSLKQFTELQNFRNNKSALFEKLTNREKLVLKFVADGLSNVEIADKMKIARVTVQNYRSSIRSKLSIDKESDYLKYALSFELINLY